MKVSVKFLDDIFQTEVIDSPSMSVKSEEVDSPAIKMFKDIPQQSNIPHQVS